MVTEKTVEQAVKNLKASDYQRGWDANNEYRRDVSNLGSSSWGLWILPAVLLFVLTASAGYAWLTVPGSVGEIALPYILLADLIYAPIALHAHRRENAAHSKAMAAFIKKWGKEPW